MPDTWKTEWGWKPGEKAVRRDKPNSASFCHDNSNVHTKIGEKSMWMKKKVDGISKDTVTTSNVGYCLWYILTIADCSNDTKDKEPQEHISSVAQQQDKEQTDHHGYHQTTATTQTHTNWELTRIWLVKRYIYTLITHLNLSGAIWIVYCCKSCQFRASSR